MQARVPSSCTRQLLIGLDAMEWNLVTQWAAEGKLPTFHRLLEQGTRAELTSTAAQLPDTVWAALYTGSNPAKFEKYFYVQYDPQRMGLQHVPDDAIKRTPFWDYLSQAGHRVGVVDAPKFPLSKHLHGFQVTNWGAHATKTARTSQPVELLGEIDTRFGHHAVGDCDRVDAKPVPLAALRERVLTGVRQHGELFRWLMHKEPWDVFFAGFSAPHCIGHHFYHGAVLSHARYQEAVDNGLAGAIEQVYRAIDQEIGQMLALVDHSTRVMVFAAHGMGPLYHASWNLPEILDLLGYGQKPPQAIASATRTVRINPWRRLKMILPGDLQYRIKAMLPQRLQDQLLFLWYAGGRKWAGARAFAVPNNDSVGAIRISVKGRDLGGIVDPGDEYQRICHDIAETLYDLTDPESGRPVVKRVTFSQEAFSGPFLHQLPDLTVLWDQSFRWEALSSPRFGTLRLQQQDARTGSHTPHGFVIVTGPGVAAGAELAGCSIYDIAPTVLEAAGVPLPADLDGQPLRLHAAPVPA